MLPEEASPDVVNRCIIVFVTIFMTEFMTELMMVNMSSVLQDVKGNIISCGSLMKVSKMETEKRTFSGRK